MKLITHLYAIIICSILSLVLITILIILCPFSIIAEVITFLKELVSGDEYEHGVWIAGCRKCFRFIKEFYNILIDKPYNPYKD